MFEQWLHEQLDVRERAGLTRTCTPVHQYADGTADVSGRRCIFFASNRYLGHFSQTQTVWTGGAGASRVAGGTHVLLHAFEEEWAHFVGTEACVVFGSGYGANVGVLQALAQRDTVVVGDKYNHASIVDGAVLSRARYVRYAHCDIEDARRVLAMHAGKRIILVTDAVFGMDGTIAPIKALAALARDVGAIFVVDEAHSGGVIGPSGRGLVAAELCPVDVRIGTFSKAYDSYGAYVAGSSALCRYVAQTARSFVYSTALPPALMTQTMLHTREAAGADDRRARVLGHARTMRNALAQAGYDVGGEDGTAIVRIVIGDARKTVELARAAYERGVFALAVRPPTVPEGSSRLRLSCTAAHTDAHVHTACAALRDAGVALGLCR
ncbi:MAG: 8-amino-7-oxononanoate synthase [Paenibacillaceae bacterium]|nr:8-amino-7-oxononanoate synthase [Paenibacillaceae bacterium]